jgi:superfamily II DNA or RNA helicase
MNPTTGYSRDDIQRWFGPRELAKGVAYIDHVSALEVFPRAITARVRGTAPEPYQVVIEMDPRDVDHLGPNATCTCPLGGYCKHSVAVLLAALERRQRRPQVSQAVLDWIEALRQTAIAPPAATRRAKVTYALFYLIGFERYRTQPVIRFLKGRADTSGRLLGRGDPWDNVERALLNPPQFVGEQDLGILRLLWAQRPRDRHADLIVTGRHGSEVMQRMLDTGRLLYSDRLIALRPGAVREGAVEWMLDGEGHQYPVIQAAPPITAPILTEPMWYLDLNEATAGRLESATPVRLLRHLAALPALGPLDVALVASVLHEAMPTVAPPRTDATPEITVVDAPLAPVLVLGTMPIYGLHRYRGYAGNYGTSEFDYAVPVFRYGDIRFRAGDRREFLTLDDGATVRVHRDAAAEERWLQSLSTHGFARVPPSAFFTSTDPGVIYGLENENQWAQFSTRIAPALRQAGWTVEMPADFRHHVLDIDAWHGEITETDNGWFDVAMGIEVQGERHALPPLLAGLLQRDARWLDTQAQIRIPDEETIILLTPAGERIRIAAGRLKPLARTLIELFDSKPSDRLLVSRWDAPRLAELANLDRWQFRGMQAVTELAERLRASAGVRAIEAPRGLGLPLRSYQMEGVAWLQYLREQGLSGILADDMGLGKTAQALAHLLIEREQGRLDRPALVVVPTSLVHNWRTEAARFAPDLRVLALQGPARKVAFDAIPAHDIVLTTYPLLWRDAKALGVHEYHMVLLDEAQIVKNAASEAARAVRTLRARHRLCMTGTPLENHLGELWSQFDFLLPGLLGDSKRFQRNWRTPIEKRGDRGRRDLLARRLRPFILRRRKEDVAKELPPKSTIVHTVELEGGQRDLYETVRSAMDHRVREEIAAKGYNRSQIVILDALLKLRQVCCDPRLLKIDAARGTQGRAKLELLMEMLPELVEEGRRVLVFSQFASMLALIAAELDQSGIGYVTLTGDTVDRATPIERFQSGAVPVFLISLKAGGVGLNLTAADTVIHFDPWWNPAVENQATDRAHRIGQDKPVFVYKLVVAGSIEEKIIALQERKAALTAGILADDAEGAVKFDEADIAALLAPLPPSERA